MYNRYLRNDDGVYTRIPMQDAPYETPPPPQHNGEAPHGDTQSHHSVRCGSPPRRSAFGDERFLRRLLGKFNLRDVDTGDILLLLILFFLFEEKADDELLVALGLLLIL